MDYLDEYLLLQKNFNLTEDYICISALDLNIYNIPFGSGGYYTLPGVGDEIVADELGKNGTVWGEQDTDCISKTRNIFDIPDQSIGVNSSFRYILLKGRSRKKSEGVIFLFHGLNEKAWDKYLVWAARLQRLTGKAVILFPITFHMNRVPDCWSNARLMNEISEERKLKYPGLACSSFANAAISTRLSLKPHRFFFSGFQTYYDIMRLIGQIKSGTNQFISPGASIDLFGYSIGAFLSEILFLADSYDNLSSSRLFLFCGGTTTDKFQPVTKTIMDSAAYEQFSSFYMKKYEDEVCANSIMKAFYSNPLPEAVAFQAMLNSQKLVEYRTGRFSRLKDRIFAIPLKQDSVIPAGSVVETLRCGSADLPVRVEVMDYPYKYSHETPFPMKGNRQETEHYFSATFSRVAEFFE
ncbi:MAG: DUF6051 family protein [Ignavibacteriales bacterium]